ncbi:MAG TPA: hypothetical protein DCE42_19870 [Myxococcales bacterium]|nr:hypothetical protein [Deltaproteobacteria bacterium]HAA57034.1 hypothetical protein [Myxococcales bacterium]|tara:strand:- start:14339 stop:15556 length:1218 start_codon:yes stop_codon:yes gene_type:complete
MSVHAVFVAPYFGASMTHCLRVMAALPDLKLGIVTCVPEAHVPKGVRLSGHYRIDNPMDPGQLTVAVRAFQKEWGRVDRLIGYLEQLQESLAAAREALGIPGIHRQVAHNFRDKNQMKKVLHQAGVPVAKQSLVRSVEDALAFLDTCGMIVLKPLDGMGSKNTIRVSTKDELFRALNILMPSPSRPVQAEEFVTGDEHTLEAMSINGEVVWHSSSYYLPGPLQVIENPWMQYCVLLPRERIEPHVESFLPTNAQALKALGLRTGMSHMEWFHRKDNSVRIGEVGARPPGVNIMRLNGLVHGVDFWAKWAELEVHHRFEMPERKLAAGCAFLRGKGRGRTVASVTGLDEALAKVGNAVVEGKRPKVGQPRSSHYEGEGWVIVQHESTQGVLNAMKEIITRTEIQYK